jgi:hypothetical protein
MAWNTVLVERLRYVISDLDDTDYIWTDLQLEKFLAIAMIDVMSRLAGWETEMGGPYTVSTNLSGSDMISPDPISGGPAAVGNLMVLGAACFIGRSELKKLGKEGGWKITDDRSTIDGTKAVENAAAVAKDYCESYAEAVTAFKSGETANGGNGLAVLSPYASANGWRGLYSYYRPSYRSNY